MRELLNRSSLFAHSVRRPCGYSTLTRRLWQETRLMANRDGREIIEGGEMPYGLAMDVFQMD